MSYSRYRDMANWLRKMPSVSDYSESQLSDAINGLLTDLEYHRAQHRRFREIVINRDIDGQR